MPPPPQYPKGIWSLPREPPPLGLILVTSTTLTRHGWRLLEGKGDGNFGSWLSKCQLSSEFGMKALQTSTGQTLKDKDPLSGPLAWSLGIFHSYSQSWGQPQLAGTYRSPFPGNVPRLGFKSRDMYGKRGNVNDSKHIFGDNLTSPTPLSWKFVSPSLSPKAKAIWIA